MQVPLLPTKLSIPAAHPELVSRPHLIDRLNEGLSRNLILIAAPAGYGKTTLWSSWAAGCGQPVAWLSLDEGDNEPARMHLAIVTRKDRPLPRLRARGQLTELRQADLRFTGRACACEVHAGAVDSRDQGGIRCLGARTFSSLCR